MRDEVNPPQPDSAEPYFTTWVTQQAVDHFGAERVFGGGMEICAGADPADGLLQVTVVGPLGRLEFVRWLPRSFRGVTPGESRLRPLAISN